MNPEGPISLEYCSPLERTANIRLYRWAMWCSLIPMTVGVGILLLYWLTETTALMGFGMIWLVVGGCIAFAGFVVSLVYLIQAFAATVERRASIRRGVLCLVLSIANVPTAIVCAAVGVGLVTSPLLTVNVANTGTKPIDSAAITIGSQMVHFGSIAPGASMHQRIRMYSSGALSAQIVRDSYMTNQELTSYVDEDSFRGRTNIMINVKDDQITHSW